MGSDDSYLEAHSSDWQDDMGRARRGYSTTCLRKKVRVDNYELERTPEVSGNSVFSTQENCSSLLQPADEALAVNCILDRRS